MNLVHRWYCRSDRWAGAVRSKLVPWALGNADLGDDVLELGPGPGISTEAIRQRARHVTAMEIDPWSIEMLAGRFGQDPAVEIVQGDATRMPFEDGRFSSAACFTMLHHVPSPDLQDVLLTEVHRVVRPGGVFLGSDSMASFRFSLYHLGDTCVPVQPDAFPDRLRAAGFADPKISTAKGTFRFRATRP